MEFTYRYIPYKKQYGGNLTYADNVEGKIVDLDLDFVGVVDNETGYSEVCLPDKTWTFFDAHTGKLQNVRFASAGPVVDGYSSVKLLDGTWTIYNVIDQKIFDGKVELSDYTQGDPEAQKEVDKMLKSDVLDEPIKDKELRKKFWNLANKAYNTYDKDIRSQVLGLIFRNPENFKNLTYISFKDEKYLNAIKKATRNGILNRVDKKEVPVEVANAEISYVKQMLAIVKKVEQEKLAEIPVRDRKIEEEKEALDELFEKRMKERRAALFGDDDDDDDQPGD